MNTINWKPFPATCPEISNEIKDYALTILMPLDYMENIIVTFLRPGEDPMEKFVLGTIAWSECDGEFSNIWQKTWASDQKKFYENVQKPYVLEPEREHLRGYLALLGLRAFKGEILTEELDRKLVEC